MKAELSVAVGWRKVDQAGICPTIPHRGFRPPLMPRQRSLSIDVHARSVGPIVVSCGAVLCISKSRLCSN
jgi:hypothetical protein